MKFLLSLACMCLFLFVSPEVQPKKTKDANAQYIDITCNGCRTQIWESEGGSYMRISCNDASWWSGFVPGDGYSGTVCGSPA